jgi:hypothetical protein
MNNLEIANAVRDKSQEAIVDNEVLEYARRIIAGLHEGIDLNEIGSLLFDYSAILSAKVAAEVAFICLGEEKFDKMADDIMENEIDNFISSLENE